MGIVGLKGGYFVYIVVHISYYPRHNVYIVLGACRFVRGDGMGLTTCREGHARTVRVDGTHMCPICGGYWARDRVMDQLVGQIWYWHNIAQVAPPLPLSPAHRAYLDKRFREVNA